jgi:polar amino acid transport system substrate-binding protein
MKYLRLLAALLLLAVGTAVRAQTPVTVYSYNDRPPFVVDKAKMEGLEYRLCEWLGKATGTYRFTLKVVTAPEAKAMVEKDTLDGILLGVNKVWFPEAVRTRYLWTPAILWDKNLVISLGARKVEYAGPASLEGLRLAGVKGFNYPALTEAVAAGKIQRQDTTSEMLALGMVADKKADVTIVSEWTYLWATLREGIAGDFYQSTKPFLEFERCILVPPSMKKLHEDLAKALTDVRKNPGWNEATKL